MVSIDHSPLSIFHNQSISAFQHPPKHSEEEQWSRPMYGGDSEKAQSVPELPDFFTSI